MEHVEINSVSAEPSDTLIKIGFEFFGRKPRTWHSTLWVSTFINEEHIVAVVALTHPESDEHFAITAAIAVCCVECVSTGFKECVEHFDAIVKFQR